MFKIAIDLGHGYVKAVSENGRSVIFPSLVGEGFERKLKDVFGTGAKRREYDVVVDGKRYFVGDLAVAESWDATRAFDESRLSHFSTPVLYAVAAALLTGSAPYPVHLAAGLPFELFKTQKDELHRLLAGLRMEVEIAGMPGKHTISFDRITLVPQGAGAFYAAILDKEGRATESGQSLLKDGGIAAIVDLGYKTTDYMLVDLSSLDIVESMCGTVNMAMNDVFVAVQKNLQEKAGDVIDLLEVERAVGQGKLWFKGREYPITDTVAECADGLAETIADRLRAVWKERQKYIRVLFLAGGGATALAPTFLRRKMPVVPVTDPQFANANGFLSLAARREVLLQKARTA